MIVRSMTELDDSPVSQIVSDGYRLIAEPDGLTPEQCDKMIAERSQPKHMAINRERFTCNVAEENGAVIGFIAFSSNKIEELFVDPALRLLSGIPDPGRAPRLRIWSAESVAPARRVRRW